MYCLLNVKEHLAADDTDDEIGLPEPLACGKTTFQELKVAI